MTFILGQVARINILWQVRVFHFILWNLIKYVLCLPFKDKWLGIMHHVCGEHEWDGATCSHGPLTEVEGGKEYLAMNSVAAKELRKIVLDHEWLESGTLCYSGTFWENSFLMTLASDLLDDLMRTHH